MDPSERSFVRHLLRLHVLRREEELFGVEQEHACLRASVEHGVSLLKRDTERLFAHDVLPGTSGVDRYARVQAVGRRDRDHLDGGVAQHLAIVGIGSWNSVTSRERVGVSGARRRDRDHLGLLGHRPHRGSDAIRLKARPNDSDSYLGH
jgi:hypothetical protein